MTWTMAKAVVKMFSNFGIYQLALALGAAYLEKMENLSNFRAGMRVLAAIYLALCLGLPERADQPASVRQEDRDRHEELEVLHLMRRVLGWLFAMHRAERCGHSALFFEALSALAPILPATGSNLYTVLVAKFLYGVRGPGAGTIREQLAKWPGVRLHRGGAVLSLDEAMEEAIRFLKGSIDDRHMSSTATIVQQLVHAQAEHEQATQLLAGYLGDRVGHDGARARAARSLDLCAAVQAIRDATSAGLPSVSALFRTAAYLGDGPGRAQILSCLRHGAERMLSTIRQHGSKVEPVSTVGTRAVNIPRAASFSRHVKQRKKHQTVAERSQEALGRMLQTLLKLISDAKEGEARALEAVDTILASFSPFPATLAEPDGSKAKADKADSLKVIEAIAGRASDDELDLAAHAVDMMQLVLKLHAGDSKVRMLAIALGHMVLQLLPANATHLYLCFDRPGLSHGAKTSEPTAPGTEAAKVTGTPAQARAAVVAAIARRRRLDGGTKLNPLLLRHDCELRRAFCITVAELLRVFTWPSHLTVTIDAEGCDDPAQPPVTLIGGQWLARPTLAHTFCEANAAMWHLLRVDATSGGVVHSSDAGAVDWGLVASTTMPDHVPLAVQFLSQREDRFQIRIDSLRSAIERAGQVQLDKRTAPGLPATWTPRQRLWSFLVAKAVAGNDYHERLAAAPAVVLRLLLERGAVVGPLCNDDGRVDHDALHRFVLLVFGEANKVAARGAVPPGPGITGDALAMHHRELQLTIARSFVQPKRSAAGYGLLPSVRAVRLSVARAATCLEYLRSVAWPARPFDGWSAPDSGYVRVGNQVAYHWDDASDGQPVLSINIPPGLFTRKRAASTPATPIHSDLPSPAPTPTAPPSHVHTEALNDSELRRSARPKRPRVYDD